MECVKLKLELHIIQLLRYGKVENMTISVIYGH